MWTKSSWPSVCRPDAPPLRWAQSPSVCLSLPASLSLVVPLHISVCLISVYHSLGLTVSLCISVHLCLSLSISVPVCPQQPHRWACTRKACRQSLEAPCAPAFPAAAVTTAKRQKQCQGPWPGGQGNTGGAALRRTLPCLKHKGHSDTCGPPKNLEDTTRSEVSQSQKDKDHLSRCTPGTKSRQGYRERKNTGARGWGSGGGLVFCWNTFHLGRQGSSGNGRW